MKWGQIFNYALESIWLILNVITQLLYHFGDLHKKLKHLYVFTWLVIPDKELLTLDRVIVYNHGSKELYSYIIWTAIQYISNIKTNRLEVDQVNKVNKNIQVSLLKYKNIALLCV